MEPLFLSDKNKLVDAYSQVLRAITALLTRAGAFLISLGIDGHIVSRGIASLADALREFQGIAMMIDDWVEHMINIQNNAHGNPVEIRKKEDDFAASPRTPLRSTHLNQSSCLEPTSAAPSPVAPYGVFSTSWSAFPQSLPQVTSPFRPDIPNTPLSIRNGPALFNHMQVVATYQTPACTLGLFGSSMTSHVTTPLVYERHLSSIETSRPIPSLFWRPPPKSHAAKLMVPDSVRHRKKVGKEYEEKISVTSVTSMPTQSLSA